MLPVLAALHPINNNITPAFDYENTLNMNGITYPVSIRDIDRFEDMNAHISVNVFGYDNKIVYPMRITENKNR